VYKRQRHLLKHFCTSYSKRHHRPLSMSVVPNPRNSYLSFTLQLVRSTYFQTRYVTYIIRHLTSTDTPRCKLRILRHATRPQIRPMEPPTSSSISNRYSHASFAPQPAASFNIHPRSQYTQADLLDPPHRTMKHTNSHRRTRTPSRPITSQRCFFPLRFGMWPSCRHPLTKKGATFD
jgi:hypothetical protein